MDPNTKISPEYRVSDYMKLGLDPTTPDTDDWQLAIKIFVDRINGRFIDPIDWLMKSELKDDADHEHRKDGFTIMAIDCLLVETLQAFRMGWTIAQGKANSRKRETDGTKKYLISEFLTSAEGFNEEFEEGRRAQMFTNHIRNGLLHYGETLGDSIILSSDDVPLVREHGNGLCINRTKFHKLLSSYLQRYCEELKAPSNIELRRRFKAKMDNICRLDQRAGAGCWA